MKLGFLTLLLLLFALSAAAQSPASILKKAEKAIGGTKQLMSVRAWTRSGTISNQTAGKSGRFISQISQPNLYHTVYDLNGVEFESAFNGKSGWKRDSRGGLQTLTGDASLLMQAEAAFRNNLWVNYKKDKAKIASGGNASVDGKNANVVRMNTAKNVEYKLYFDQSTNLLLREEISKNGLSKAFVYKDYRDVNGTKQPFGITIEQSGESLSIELFEVRPDAAIASSVFDFPKISGEPLPDIARLLTELRSNEDKVEELLDQYSFTQRSTKREAGKDGILRETESETYQLSFYKGNRIRRLIEKNGKPLSKNDQEDADKDAARQVEEIEKEIAKKEKQNNSGPPSEKSRRISTAEVLRASKLLNPRRERFRGRDVIVFDFEPDPTFDYKNAKSMLKFFGKTAGVMWIDEKDKQVARLEAYLFDSFNVGGGVLAKLKKGASFTLEQERLNDEIWLPSLADINLSVRVLLVKGIDVNQSIRSYDYRKFTTEVKDAKVGDPKSN
ncbi:MAG: hypothetical protein HOP17_08750 [Acidobacteria bacterium]|nr:hypothetical protein [Acidobacteriota bacterium]